MTAYPTDAAVLAALRALGAAEAEAWAPHIGAACRANAIDTPARLAGFLGNCAHESANFTVLSESLNYTPERLVTVFGRHRISVEEAARWGRKPGRPADQRSIANRLYGGDFGRKNLGNTETGDGWLFRGSGLIQATGRAAFAKLASALAMPLAAVGDHLRTKEGAAMGAAVWWRQHGCNEMADTGDAKALRRRVNGGGLGLAEVVRATDVLLAALEAPDVGLA